MLRKHSIRHALVNSSTWRSETNRYDHGLLVHLTRMYDCNIIMSKVQKPFKEYHALAMLFHHMMTPGVRCITGEARIEICGTRVLNCFSQCVLQMRWKRVATQDEEASCTSLPLSANFRKAAASASASDMMVAQYMRAYVQLFDNNASLFV